MRLRRLGVISPSLKVTDAVKPSVTITSLASKEFATGILRLIRTETTQPVITISQ